MIGRASVDREDLPGDVTGIVREQEAGDARDVLGLGDAPERHDALRAPDGLVGLSTCRPPSACSPPPGQMQLARMPCGPHCTATSRVNAATPPLLAVYPEPKPCPRIAAVDAIVTMLRGAARLSSRHEMRDARA